MQIGKIKKENNEEGRRGKVNINGRREWKKYEDKGGEREHKKCENNKKRKEKGVKTRKRKKDEKKNER